MADKTSQLILGALQRAAAEPAGAPLYATRSAPGLFPVTTTARQAAQRCLDQGFLHAVAPESRGGGAEFYVLTDRGLAHLLSETDPRQVLEDFLRALEARQGQIAQLLDSARQMQAGLDALRSCVERVLRQPRSLTPTNGTVHASPPTAWTEAALDYLRRRRSAEDCPLPELYRHLRKQTPALTPGQFHDGLRELHERGRVYLHPWTGPLYELPEPPFVLLVGHEPAYYASFRESRIEDRG